MRQAPTVRHSRDMPRRRGPHVDETYRRARLTRWRLLLRHPGFRKDLEAVLSARAGWDHPSAPPPEIYEKARALREKWGLGLPGLQALRSAPELSLDTIPHFDRLLDHDEGVAPVSVLHDQDGELYITAAMLQDVDTLYLALDLEEPLDLLVEYVEQEIRRAKKQRKPHLKADPHGRRRLDKIDFQLSVYDQAERSTPFSVIARDLQRQTSTVKSAFLAARRAIFGDAPGLSKTELPIASIDYETHVRRCATCRSAELVDDMCAVARAWAGQDEVGRRELLVGDLPEPQPETGRRRRPAKTD
jgi:hypothetical protein